MNSEFNTPVIHAFDAAAATYDQLSQVQREIACELVSRAARYRRAAPKILDLGCGTGHAIEAALELWPAAEITALDAAPAMLAALRQKFPGIKTLCRDAADADGIGRYDLILSSMMLHWLPDPRAALSGWRKLLGPGGRLHVAVPLEGSLGEWRDACRAAGLADGLWRFPEKGFAEGLSERAEQKAFPATYPDATAFLQSLKGAGAHKSPPGRRPHSAAALRRLLNQQEEPFTATFRIAFLTFRAETSNEADSMASSIPSSSPAPSRRKTDV